MTFEKYFNDLKKDLLKTCDNNKNNIDKYLKANIGWIKKSYDRNSESIDSIAYAMFLDYDIVD